MSDLNKLSVELNSELELILNHSDGNDEIAKYLKNYLRKLVFWRYAKWLLIITVFVAILSASIYYIDVLNWNASAIGRLALIKWILPYYNWKPLYNSRCFIENGIIETKQFEEKQTESVGFKGENDFNKDDCAVCENLGITKNYTF